MKISKNMPKKDVIEIFKEETMGLLSTAQAAVIISKKTGKPISIREVRHECRLKKIKATLVGNSYAIDEADLEAYVRRRPGPVPKIKKDAT